MPTRQADPIGPAQPELIQAIRKAVIQAKCGSLRRTKQAEIRVEPQAGLPNGYRRRITRAEFEALIRPLVERTLGPCRQALADAGLEPSDIDEAVLVGGVDAHSARAPASSRSCSAGRRTPS